MSDVNAEGGVVLALCIGVAGVALVAHGDGPPVSIATRLGVARGLHTGWPAQRPPSQPPAAPEVSQPEVPGVVEQPASRQFRVLAGVTDDDDSGAVQRRCIDRIDGAHDRGL